MVNKPRKKAKSEYKFTKLTNIFNLLFCDELFSLCYFFVLKLFYYDLIKVEQKKYLSKSSLHTGAKNSSARFQWLSKAAQSCMG